MSTDQQQTEQALLQCQQSAEELGENEAFYRSIIKSSPDCIKVLDLEGNLLSMPGVQGLLGIEDIAPFLNKSWLEFWEGTDRLAAQAAVKVAATGGSGKFTGFSRFFHGQAKWWEVVVSPILGADGQPARLLTVSRDVTDRYKAQEDLRQCTVQFEALLNEAPMGVFLITDDFCISQANPAARKVWPSSPELIGRNFEELMRSLWPAAMADDIVKKYRHTLATGESYQAVDVADERIDHGGHEYYEWQINRIVLADGRYGVVCYFRDISERALAQQAIHEGEERYRNLFNTMDQGFCVIDVLFDAHDKAIDYRFIEANPAFEPLTGLGEVTGKRMREIAPNHDQVWFDIYGEVALTGVAKRFVNQAHALGERWFDVYASRLGGPQSRKVALLFSDITDRMSADKALRHSEERFRAFVTASADVVYRMSPDWREMQLLQGQNFIIDTTKPDADWQTHYIDPPDQPQVMAVIQEAIKTKSVYELEHRVRRTDGTLGWTLSRAVPLLDQAGEITEWFGTASDITEHKRAEQALRESEERYRSLFNSIDEGYCLIDMLFDAQHKAIDYRFLEVNPTFAKQTGLSDATGKRMRELVPNLEEHWFDIFGQVALTGEPVRFTNEAKAMGERWFDVFAFRMGGPSSSTVALLFNNISERKRDELALRESQERYRNLFNAIDEGFCIIEMIFDAHGKAVDYYFVEVNPSFERHYGLHDVTGKRVRELLPDLEENWFEIYGQVALTGEPIRFVNELKAQNRWLDVYAARLGQSGSGQVAVVFTNITERTQAEQALRHSEARFRALFDWGPLAMYTVDAAGVIQEFNRNAVVLWGREPIPRDASELYCGSYKMHHPDGTALLHAQTPVAAVLSGEIPAALDVEVVMERPDGSKITVIANIVPLKNSQGDITGAMNCLYDITERSRLERQALEQAQTLITLDRRKDEFLAMLNHELRNPIAAIFNAVNLLETAKKESPAQTQGRSIIARQVGQLKHLVDDLLEVSRVTTGTIRLRKDKVNMRSVVEHAVETTASFVKQRRHELIMSLPEDPIFLHADAARLEQVVVNLLTNAAKYTDEGGCIWLSVELHATHEAGAMSTLVLKVRDSGIGIAPELLPRIFELFTQAERSLDRTQGGLGIGLSLVQQLVALHGGTTQAVSVVGQGSEFIVQLPAMPSALPALQSADSPKSQPSTKSCRVLVVDDNRDAAQSLAMLLEMTGHKVSLAYDGPSAVQAALDFQPDVVLLDIGLPKLNGYEVAQRIRQQATLKKTVLVALTGYGLESDRKRSQAAGFDHHLVKPADFDEIETILAGV